MSNDTHYNQNSCGLLFSFCNPPMKSKKKKGILRAQVFQKTSRIKPDNNGGGSTTMGML